jgi:hypothetical protein
MTISNCDSSSKITGKSEGWGYMGGLFGGVSLASEKQESYFKIENCSSDTLIESNHNLQSNVGGIVGSISFGNYYYKVLSHFVIENVNSLTSLITESKSSNRVGGIIGVLNYYQSTIFFSLDNIVSKMSIASIIGPCNAGGVLSSIEKQNNNNLYLKISNCFSYSNVSCGANYCPKEITFGGFLSYMIIDYYSNETKISFENCHSETFISPQFNLISKTYLSGFISYLSLYNTILSFYNCSANSNFNSIFQQYGHFLLIFFSHFCLLFFIQKKNRR